MYKSPSSKDTAQYSRNSESGLYAPSRREFMALSSSALAGMIAGCGGGNGGVAGPSNVPENITINVYNATDGLKGQIKMKVEKDIGVTISAQSVINELRLSDVISNEFALRYKSDALGTLVSAAGSSLSFVPDKDEYDLFLPKTGARYDCVPQVTMLGRKRDFRVGAKNKTNGTGPMEIWIDAINNLNTYLKSRDGKKYGSIVFEGVSSKDPDFTVGFSKDVNPSAAGSAWREGTEIYMLGNGYYDYDRPTIKDTALAEVWEMLFGVDDICGKSSRETIGLANITNDKQAGLSPQGINLTTRNITRAR